MDKKRGHFSRVPGAAVYDKHITNAPFRVLAALGRYADPGGWCHPSVGTMAKGMGVSRQAIQNSIRKLERLGYVERIAQWGKKHGCAPNKYKLNYPPDPDDHPLADTVANNHPPADDLDELKAADDY